MPPPYGISGSCASEFFPCKPVNDYISSNSVGERVGKSPVALFLEDVVGAHALRHLRKFRLGKISLQARERIHYMKEYSVSSNSVGERVLIIT
mgnify:CR=1 FL=1